MYNIVIRNLIIQNKSAHSIIQLHRIKLTKMCKILRISAEYSVSMIIEYHSEKIADIFNIVF